LETEIPKTELYQDFLFAINSPVTRERYSRLRSFFVYIGIEGTTMEERCRKFVEKVKESEDDGNSKWAYACVIKFLQHQKNRCDKKEITGSTVRGYYKAVKLFAEINDILLPWTKIKRGLPRGRHYADDRIPTLEEIRKLVESPDRRMKAIVYTMVSSGIRLGAWFATTLISFVSIAKAILALLREERLFIVIEFVRVYIWNSVMRLFL
jgi:hypothetical protein